ncbi:hypothetical protein LCGC14_1131270 [marine sediment metagenome]|uniref:Uncharacterized protein n=1 Tax=marine sediment metagenome TaxID=412755 RepID=A0A0F9M5X1_9ZZZZ
MAKLSRKEREILYGKHSPAGYAYLQSKKVKKLKRVKRTVKPTEYKKIAYYGQGRETADAQLRRIKRGK